MMMAMVEPADLVDLERYPLLDPVALEPVVAAMKAVVADPEFVAQGDSGGFTALWLDGAAWTTQAGSERDDLARLWETDPWLPTGTG